MIMMLHNVKLLSSYMKAISSWPEDGENTIKSIPSPYQIARKINISANSSYKMWNLIFEKEYIKDMIIMPEVFPGGLRRYYLMAMLPFEYLKDVEHKLGELPFVEILHSSNYLKKKRESQGVENYSEIGHIQFISNEDHLMENLDEIGNAFRESGLEFKMMNYFPYSEVSTIPTQGQIRLVNCIAYKSVKNFSTEEITDELSYSRKRARKNLDMIVENRFVKGKVIFNFKKIPNIITKQISIMVPEADTGQYTMWFRSKKLIRDNLIYYGNYPHTLTLTVFGESMEEIDNITEFLSENFNEIYTIDRFETTFYSEIKNFYRSIQISERE
ncbi:MAG: hypothetical protein M1581_05290 [Candidatus Thermoplasmatota archaeon]|nr:hypothetical protein [Candidatus Thermoplasmatota archaeon]